ncbi:Vitelline membrane outer layer protein 1 [Mactra antiquata]
MVKLGLSLVVYIAIHLQSCMAQSVISVQNGFDEGYWGKTEFCPHGMYAVGFEQKIQEFRWDEDNTALNGIKLACRNKTERSSCSDQSITSSVGRHGDWQGQLFCPPGSYMSQFFLKLQKSTIQNLFQSEDNTAVQYISFLCQNESDPDRKSYLVQYPGYWHGNNHNHEESTECPSNTYICGIKTKVQSINKPGVDHTGLNDVIMFCCQ